MMNGHGLRRWIAILPLAALFGADAPSAPLIVSRPSLTSNQAQLRWLASTNYSYRLENSFTLSTWLAAAPPLAAPPGGGLLTNVINRPAGAAFYRVRADVLTNSPVPVVAGQHTNLFIAVDGLLRRYRLFIPTNLAPGVSNALAFILHGHGQSGDAFAQLHPLLFYHAQTNNLILVLPDGLEIQNDSGWNIFDALPGMFEADDVNFILALLERIGGALTLDRKRIYAGGFSMGGQMAYNLAGRTTNVFAAFAAVESSIGNDLPAGPAVHLPPPPTEPRPVLIMNCTNSCARPFWGGVNQDGIYMTPAFQAVSHWTNGNACLAGFGVVTNTIVSSNLARFSACGAKPPAGQTQTNHVIVQRWANCAGDSEVVFVTLTDGGHIWPDVNDNLGLDASREVLRFFMQHARP